MKHRFSPKERLLRMLQKIRGNPQPDILRRVTDHQIRKYKKEHNPFCYQILRLAKFASAMIHGQGRHCFRWVKTQRDLQLFQFFFRVWTKQSVPQDWQAEIHEHIHGPQPEEVNQALPVVWEMEIKEQCDREEEKRIISYLRSPEWEEATVSGDGLCLFYTLLQIKGEDSKLPDVPERVHRLKNELLDHALLLAKDETPEDVILKLGSAAQQSLTELLEFHHELLSKEQQTRVNQSMDLPLMEVDTARRHIELYCELSRDIRHYGNSFFSIVYSLLHQRPVIWLCTKAFKDHKDHKKYIVEDIHPFRSALKHLSGPPLCVLHYRVRYPNGTYFEHFTYLEHHPKPAVPRNAPLLRPRM